MGTGISIPPHEPLLVVVGGVERLEVVTGLRKGAEISPMIRKECVYN
jgi:hypothetical protein